HGDGHIEGNIRPNQSPEGIVKPNTSRDDVHRNQGDMNRNCHTPNKEIVEDSAESEFQPGKAVSGGAPSQQQQGQGDTHHKGRIEQKAWEITCPYFDIVNQRKHFRKLPDISCKEFHQSLKGVLNQKYERVQGNKEPEDCQNIDNQPGDKNPGSEMGASHWQALFSAQI
ncbi:MAG: hypothetical protein KAR73_13215, partial [Spirochaetales bacterium]|nr:hypothetical protein [Spirochaetales bacterium]